MEKQRMSPVDLCKASGASLSLIYSLVWSGKIKAEKLAGKWSIPESEAARFIAARQERQGGQNGR